MRRKSYALSDNTLARLDLSGSAKDLEDGAKIRASIHSLVIEPFQAETALLAKETCRPSLGVDIAVLQPNELNGVDVEALHHFLHTNGLPLDRAMLHPLHNASCQAEPSPALSMRTRGYCSLAL